MNDDESMIHSIYNIKTASLVITKGLQEVNRNQYWR